MNATPASLAADSISREQLAHDVLALAQRGRMPGSYWGTDSRVARACLVLGLDPARAANEDWPARAAELAAAAQTSRPEPGTAQTRPPLASTQDTAPEAAREVWTDGACSGNPGPGGWGWVTPDGRSGSGGEAHTTNQRMEIAAVLDALRTLPERPVVVVSDSRYVVDCFTKKWHVGWVRKGWVNSQGKPVANRDLWEALVPLATGPGVSFRWVKGHAGHALNEAADALARAATPTRAGAR